MCAEVVLAVVTDAIEPFHTGGKEARYAALLPRLTEHGIRVDVHTMKWWDGDFPPAADGMTFHALGRRRDLYTGTRRSVWQAVTFAASTSRMLTRRFDVLEADAIPFLQLFPLKLVALLRRKRFVVTWHEVWGAAYWTAYLGRFGSAAAAVERFAAALPDHIVAASEGTAQRLREMGVADARITVVPNGIDAAEIAAVAPSPAVGDILCVGRLLAHKNVDVLVDALSLLHADGRAATLTIVGTGPERGRIQSRIESLQLGSYIEILAPLDDRADLLAAMKGATVLAFPTVREGFGLVALEALACGTPVVTTDHPDNNARHLVAAGVNGYTYAGGARELAAALALVLDDPDAMRAGAAAAGTEFSWDALAAELAKAVRG